MYPLGRAFGAKGASSHAGLVRLLTTSRVLKAYSIRRADDLAFPPWVRPALGLLIVLVTAALGLHAWLYSLAPLSRDEAALATYLALLFTVSWVSAIGLVSAVSLLAVLLVSKDRRLETCHSDSSLTADDALTASRSAVRGR